MLAERPPLCVSRPSAKVAKIARAAPDVSVKKLIPPGPVLPADDATHGPDGSEVHGPKGVEHLAIPVEYCRSHQTPAE